MIAPVVCLEFSSEPEKRTQRGPPRLEPGFCGGVGPGAGPANAARPPQVLVCPGATPFTPDRGGSQARWRINPHMACFHAV